MPLATPKTLSRLVEQAPPIQIIYNARTAKGCVSPTAQGRLLQHSKAKQKKKFCNVTQTNNRQTKPSMGKVRVSMGTTDF